MDVDNDYFEEQILKYLRGQEGATEDERVEDDIKISKISESDVRKILDGVLQDAQHEIMCKEMHKKYYLEHHQYPLFELPDLIPDFYLDEEICEQLAFRETLLISDVGVSLTATEPKALGGACLDIQTAIGHQPKERKKSPSELRFIRLCDSIQKIVVKNVNLDTGTKSQWNEIVDEKLKKYEQFLEAEMKKERKKFVIHFSSQFNVNFNGGSTITAWVDQHFHTLEEKRREFICELVNDKPFLNERTLYAAIEEDKYYIKHNNRKDKIALNTFYTFSKTKDYVGEGANFLLYRYLAISQYKGTFELSAMYINGNMCRNIYKCEGPHVTSVGGNQINVCRIFRTIIEECGLTHICTTDLTLSGRIISQEWENCAVIMNINPLIMIDTDVPPYERIDLKSSWENDLYLYSKYLDYKYQSKLEMESYLTEYPEVKDIIADFLQNIIISKPEHTIQFTINYFKDLSPFELPHQAYFQDQDTD